MKPLYIFILATFFLSCKKQISDTYLVPSTRFSFLTVKVTSPVDGQAVPAGRNVAITASITNFEQLQKVRLIIINGATAEEVLRLEKYLEVKTYNLSETFTPEAGKRYVIKLEAWGSDNNKAETYTGFVCN